MLKKVLRDCFISCKLNSILKQKKSRINFSMASKLKKKAKEKPVAGTEAVSTSVASVDSLEKLLGKTDKELKPDSAQN
ncbi:MAG: hypothetical protein R2857_10435 [Vampirovibrionales bacterium]